MEYVKFGKTGLDVSRLCLGCMTYGVPDRGTHPWTLDEEKSRPLIKQAVELGINFFDTANIYSDGTSEEIVGRALEGLYAARRRRDRDEGLLPHAAGTERRAACRARRSYAKSTNSLRRLGTDYRRSLPDPSLGLPTPIEETLEALHDVVKAGKARYIGASSHVRVAVLPRRSNVPTCTAGRDSSRCRTTSTCSTARRSARCCRYAPTEGIGVMPWSPLARGRLTRELGRDQYAPGDRRIRQDTLRAISGSRSRHHRSGQCHRLRPRRAAGSGRAGLGASEGRRDVADHRCIEAGPIEGRGCRAFVETVQ